LNRTASSQGSRKIVRALKIAAAGAVVLLAVAALSTVFYGKAANVDFIEYWTSGKLMRQHQNPYSQSSVYLFEKQAGSDLHAPVVMRNPPWSLFLVAPLGYMSLQLAAFVWLLAMIVSLVVSVRLLSSGSKPPPIVAYVFAPVLYSTMAGQTPLFFLLGTAVFLHFYKSRPWLAGLALALPAIKPHLFLLVWPVLLLECIRARRWRVLAGGVVGLALASAIAVSLDPHVWTDYLSSMRDEHMQLHLMNNLPFALRMLVPGWPAWVQVVPAIPATIWAIWYWWRHREQWEWTDQGTLLLAVSVLVSPYSWPFDQVLFLPAILRVCSGPMSKRTLSVLVGLSALASVMILKIPLTSLAYVWTGPAWLLWYLWARQQNARVEQATGTAILV
jgi:hypothetical protein